MGGRDDGAGELSILGADAGEKPGLTTASSGETLVGDQFDVRVGDVGKSLGCGAGVSARHVGHAVVEDAFLDIDRVVVSRGAGSFGATPLIDGDVDEDAAGAHPAEHSAGDEFWGFGSGNENGPNEEVDVGKEFIEMSLIGKERVGGVHGDVEETHPFEIDLEDGDIGA